MSRETVEQKAARLLVSGRLIVTRVAAGEIEATCDGDTGRYDLAFTLDMWSCSCPARGHCAHLAALQLVTVQPRRPGP